MGYKRHYLSKSSELNIELVTSQWKDNNRGFDLTWKGKCIPDSRTRTRVF